MSKINFTSNNRARELKSLRELSKAEQGIEREEFDYVTGDEQFQNRFFPYTGSWYDVQEFEPATGEIAAAGWDGQRGESYFSAVLIRYPDDGTGPDYQSVVVGYAHW